MSIARINKKKIVEYDSYTKLLANLDGSDGATSFTATTGQVATFIGTSQLDTAQKRFGTASLLLDGNSDYITFPDDAGYDFESGEFTTDFWIRFNDKSGTQRIVTRWDHASGKRSWQVRYEGAEDKLYFYYSENGTSSANIASAVCSIVNDTWYHIAVVRDGDTLRFFVNGVSKGTGDLSGKTIFATDSGITIGAEWSGASDFVNGWIDELRISKGVAIWTSDFTPPTKASGIEVSKIQKVNLANIAKINNISV